MKPAYITLGVVLLAIVAAGTFSAGTYISETARVSSVISTLPATSTTAAAAIQADIAVPDVASTTLAEDTASASRKYRGIAYNPQLGAPTDASFTVSSFGNDVSIKGALKTKISSSSAEYYIIEDDGPSGDPHFEFYALKDGLPVDIGGTPTGLVIPGNGFMYTKSRSDEIFTASRKYRIGTDGRVEEVPQPLLYVGLRTKSTQGVRLSSLDGKQTVATIATGTEVEIVAASEDTDKGDSFLVKTPSGLLGWTERGITGMDQCTDRKADGSFGSLHSMFIDLCYMGD